MDLAAQEVDQLFDDGEAQPATWWKGSKMVP